MAPPGISTFFHNLDTITFYSHCGTPSAPLKPAAPSSSSPTPKSFQSSMPYHSPVHSDHDYIIKPFNHSSGFGMVSNGVEGTGSALDHDYSNGAGDAMLSSCAVDLEKAPEDEADTDFLKELDDMSFSLDDLDPCCEVEMEDSFQDFIDSALEQSYPSLLSDFPAGRQKRNNEQDAEIFNKEQFLAMLNLRPVEENQNIDDVLSPSVATVTPRSSFSSVSSLDTTVSSTICRTMFNTQNTCSYDAVPTKQCSCLELECMSKSVYSTAHAPFRDCVRTCPSTLVTESGSRTTDCSNCSQTKTTREMLASPLFIDTSSSELSETFRSTTEDSLDFLVEDDRPSGVDKEAADIMKWLNESQQNSQQHDSGNNSNFAGQQQCIVAPFFTETSKEGGFDAPSFDLESFVDLNCYETETQDSEKQQTIINEAYRTTSKDTNVHCISDFKLSMVVERQTDNDNFRQNSHSDIFCEDSPQEPQTLRYSDLSYHIYSPGWSRTNSVQSSISPSSLASMDFSSSSDFEDIMEDSSVKNHLALLNLFSDDNATSLLHTDSTVSDIRFM